MVAVVRPAVTLTAAVVALGPALAVTPALVANPPVVPMSITDARDIALTGFIADIYNSIEPAIADVVDTVAALVAQIPVVGPPIAEQINILFTYSQAAVAGTVYWVDDLVTPIVNGDFWPLSGDPGNYISGAINSTINWVDGLVSTAIGFAQAEIDFFTGLIPNVPNVINDVINAVENVINWIIGWIPNPFAAVEAPAATPAAAVAATVTAEATPSAPAAPAAPAGDPWR